MSRQLLVKILGEKYGRTFYYITCARCKIIFYVKLGFCHESRAVRYDEKRSKSGARREMNQKKVVPGECAKLLFHFFS